MCVSISQRRWLKRPPTDIASRYGYTHCTFSLHSSEKLAMIYTQAQINNNCLWRIDHNAERWRTPSTTPPARRSPPSSTVTASSRFCKAAYSCPRNHSRGKKERQARYVIKPLAAPPYRKGRKRKKSIPPNKRVRKSGWISVPLIFSTTFDSVSHWFLGNSVEGGFFTPSEKQLSHRESIGNSKIGRLAKKPCAFCQRACAPPRF